MDWLGNINKITTRCSGIYRIFSILNNKSYIGVSTNLKLRLRSHYYKLMSSQHIIKTNIDGTLSHPEEYKRHMSKLMTGRKLSEGTKERLRLLNIGKTGHKHSEEHKLHMSKLMTGRLISKSTRDKMSNSKRCASSPLKGKPGRKYSEEEKTLRSRMYLGNNNPRAIKLIDNSNNIYGSIKEACVLLDCSRSYIEKLIKNKTLRKT
jgi:hypothetical protein